MTPYDPPRPPGQRRDDAAWISPSTPSGNPPTPRGVVFSAASGGGPPGPYDGLREIPDGEPLWPLEDPSQPPATPPRSNIPPFLIGLLVGVTLAAEKTTPRGVGGLPDGVLGLIQAASSRR